MKATTLNCSHSFCAGCIARWLKLSPECPICREIVTSCNYSLALDTFIGSMFETLPLRVQQKRTALFVERREIEVIGNGIKDMCKNEKLVGGRWRQLLSRAVTSK